ncbi:UNVERIFIED_CONTAM: hypothetical protein FKN15_059692 [Acipenser sinensis]
MLGAASPACDVNMDPSRVVVRFGDPVTLSCSTTREDVLATGWESSVSPVYEQDSKIAVWNVSSLTVWDAEPKCFINYKNEPRQCVEKLDLVIYKYPESVSLIAPEFMKIGVESSITCQVLDVAPIRYLSVKLYKGDEQLGNRSFTHDSTRFPVNESVPFPVTPTRADNGVEYTCVAELQLGPGPKLNPAKLSPPLKTPVVYKPSLLSAAEQNIEVRKGGSIVLKCSADGNPAPTYEWKYPKADNVQEITKDGVSTVNITRASWSNNRVYECHAKNMYGVARKNITLTVKAHRYHPCADSGGAKMNTRCPPKCVPSAARFFTHGKLTVQPPQSYSVGGQRSSGQLTGKPAGARPDYRGRGRDAFVCFVVAGVGVLVFAGLVVGFIYYGKIVT